MAVGDSARNLPAITLGLLGGQDVLTVPTMRDKLSAQLAGLGCGNLPVGLAKPYIDDGRLVPKLLVESRMSGALYCSWSTAGRGRALLWFLKRLDDPAVRRRILP